MSPRRVSRPSPDSPRQLAHSRAAATAAQADPRGESRGTKHKRGMDLSSLSLSWASLMAKTFRDTTLIWDKQGTGQQ